MTLDEYIKLVNPSNKSHDSSAYDYDLKQLNSFEQDKSEFPTLIQRSKINGIMFEVRLRQDQWGHTFAVFDGKLKVASAQDEWGCMLIMVAREYRGFGLGDRLATLAHSYEPDKPSGGFTPSGRRTFIKVHRNFVRQALIDGLYTRMVRSGEITAARVREILSSAKLEDRAKPKEKKLGSEDSNNWLLYSDDDGGFIIYDKNLKDALDEDQHWQERMIKGAILVRELTHREHRGILVYFGGDTDSIKSFLITLVLGYCRRNKFTLYLDEEDIKYVSSSIAKIGPQDMSTGFRRYPVESQVDVPYTSLVHKEQFFRKQFDKYGEFQNHMMELAYSKWQ